MRMLPFLSLLLSSAVAAPSTAKRASSNLPNHVVTQFPVGTWLENLAVRSNGNILVTALLPDATLYEISDPTSKKPTVTGRFTVRGISSLLGITELNADSFAIVGGNYSATAGAIKGSYGLWTADFAKGKNSKPTLVTIIPEAELLNGATTVPGHPNLVLIADSFQGLVYRVDISTGKYEIVAQYPEMAGVSGSIGINGLHIQGDYLWWTNDYLTTVYKLKVTSEGAPAHGAKVEKVAKLSATALDDFIFGPDNKDIAWVCTNDDNHVYALKPNGENKAVAGISDLTEVPVGTAAKFGRTKKDNKVLYVTTGAKTSTQAGKVQAIDTSNFRWN